MSELVCANCVKGDSEHLSWCNRKYDTIKKEDDPVNHPKHYNSHPSGIEAIVICEHTDFCLGNAIKYILRAL